MPPPDRATIWKGRLSASAGEVLGFKGNLKWTQADDALEIEVPPQKPCDYAVTFKIVGA